MVQKIGMFVLVTFAIIALIREPETVAAFVTSIGSALGAIVSRAGSALPVRPVAAGRISMATNSSSSIGDYLSVSGWARRTLAKYVVWDPGTLLVPAKPSIGRTAEQAVYSERRHLIMLFHDAWIWMLLGVLGPLLLLRLSGPAAVVLALVVDLHFLSLRVLRHLRRAAPHIAILVEQAGDFVA